MKTNHSCVACGRRWWLALACTGLLSAPLTAEQVVPLIDPAAPAAEWHFGNGAEFPGAKGALTLDPAVLHDGKPTLRLDADLSAGGNYVEMSRDVAKQKLEAESVSFWLKAPGYTGLTLRLIDGAKRCHQISLKFDVASDDWKLVSFPLRRFFDKRGTTEAVQGVAKYESWGGDKKAGDGWVGTLQACVLLAGRKGERTALWVSGLNVGVRDGTLGWDCGFENSTALPAGWRSEGTVSVAAGEAFAGGNALLLQRGAEQREQPCSATSPDFPVAPGTWEISAALAVALESPDASYCGSMRFIALDAAGKELEGSEIATPFGRAPWVVVRKQVATPARTAAGRVVLRLNKTIGSFSVDALSAKPLATPKPVATVERIVLAADAQGALFKPDEPRTWKLRVESRRALAPDEQRLAWSVHDYWGAEIAPAATLALTADGADKGRNRYVATLDLAGVPLDIGRYYELHAAVDCANEDPARSVVGFAVLPEAASKAFPPARIPFTARNWDNRLPAYISLSDRLGFRIIGIWGGAEATPPYKANAPGIEMCAKLGAAVLTGCPANLNSIEYRRQGWEKWTDEATIRGAVRSWFAAFGGHQPKPIVVNLGNEPHGSGEQVKQQVAAYKIAYDEIKKVAPDSIVVATSVGATEEYFQAGYQDACDAFDFHVYEAPENVRHAVMAYQAMMAKYHCVKPIWATEIGLNSQGLTRQHIAGDMARKFAVFFAAGGANMNWFDLLYPDGDGKAQGTSGDAFNMFDSRYNAYAARLDAVMCYHLINGILDKACLGERDWGEGRHGVLFRDAAGACFLIAWQDKGTSDVLLPLPGVTAARVIRVDGRETALQVADGGIGLTLGADPLLIHCSGLTALPEQLAASPLRVTSAPIRLMRGAAGMFTVVTGGAPERVSVLAPLGWTVTRDGAEPLKFAVTSPVESQAREGDLLIRQSDATGVVTAELSRRPVLTNRLSLEVRGVPATGAAKPGIQLVLANQATQPQAVRWVVALASERARAGEGFSAPAATSAYLADAGNGALVLPPGSEQTLTIPLAGLKAGSLYQVEASLIDAAGSTITCETDVRDLLPAAP